MARKRKVFSAPNEVRAIARERVGTVKPSKAIADVEVAGVKKKMKDKAFARAVKREDITLGAELLGIPVEEHVGNCLVAMQARAGELGL